MERNFQPYVFGPIPTWEKLKWERHGYKNEKKVLNSGYEGYMDKLVEMNDQYNDWISEVSKHFRQRQVKAAICA